MGEWLYAGAVLLSITHHSLTPGASYGRGDGALQPVLVQEQVEQAGGQAARVVGGVALPRQLQALAEELLGDVASQEVVCNSAADKQTEWQTRLDQISRQDGVSSSR